MFVPVGAGSHGTVAMKDAAGLSGTRAVTTVRDGRIASS